MAGFGSLSDAPLTVLLTGARVVDPAAGRDEIADVVILDGRIGKPDALPANTPRLDASGLVVAPGLCDLHTHLREPGGEGAETIASGTRAAAHGGYTTVCAMPNTDPPLDEAARVAMVASRASTAAARVRVIGAATRGRSGEAASDAGALVEVGAVGVSDDGAAIPSAALARRLMQALVPLDVPLIEHAEDATLAAGTLMRAGQVATRLGLAAWPPSAEVTIVERDIALAEEVGGRVHLTHLSSAASVDAVRRAKARGVRVTCDVTPHHLTMTDAWVAGDRRFAWEEPSSTEELFTDAIDPERAYDGRCRVNPPLPSRADAHALLQGLADGTIDAVATDHAPHPPERKLVELAGAAPGIIGLETALSLGLAAVGAGCVTMMGLLAAMATHPASIIGEERSLAIGSVADVVVFDPGAQWRVDRAALASASSNTPLLGMDVPGVVRLTISGGRVTYDDRMGVLG